jgi:DNA-binding CsgD family transcriptional regulator
VSRCLCAQTPSRERPATRPRPLPDGSEPGQRNGLGPGIAARSHALIVDDASADDLYAEAVERLARTRVGVDLARAHLLYGEWLRRQRRPLDARDELRIAHEMFTGFGMEAFAQRARVELRAGGERVRKRTVETLDQLTPQESQVSRLAARGDTNREIAAQLFISPSTVEYHLRKVPQARREVADAACGPHIGVESLRTSQSSLVDRGSRTHFRRRRGTRSRWCQWPSVLPTGGHKAYRPVTHVCHLGLARP